MYSSAYGKCQDSNTIASNIPPFPITHAMEFKRIAIHPNVTFNCELNCFSLSPVLFHFQHHLNDIIYSEHSFQSNDLIENDLIEKDSSKCQNVGL